jgi:CRP-like cAMP-binding protein
VRTAAEAVADDIEFCVNRLLSSLKAADCALLRPFISQRTLGSGEVLFEPGDDVAITYFPCSGAMVSLRITSSDGKEVEAATIGREGAVGGIVSAGKKPAYARAIVQIGGPAYCIPTTRIEDAKCRSPAVHDLFCRYADVLLAQVMQSVACSALHAVEQRCARWLLATHDRVGQTTIPLTQEALADMLGVRRTTISAVAKSLQERGAIRYVRGRVDIISRKRLLQAACECYEAVESHFARILPDIEEKN